MKEDIRLRKEDGDGDGDEIKRLVWMDLRRVSLVKHSMEAVTTHEFKCWRSRCRKVIGMEGICHVPA